MSYYRTADHRRLRAELIQRWSRGEQSSGHERRRARLSSSRNGYKGRRTRHAPYASQAAA
jgi:hypothetical protein